VTAGKFLLPAVVSLWDVAFVPQAVNYHSWFRPSTCRAKRAQEISPLNLKTKRFLQEKVALDTDFHILRTNLLLFLVIVQNAAPF
jgi:hypothetical protein